MQTSRRSSFLNLVLAILRMVDRINDAVAAAAGFLVIPLLGVAMYEVIARYLFNSPSMWAAPVMSLIFFALVVPAGGHLLRTGGHVRMDAFYARADERTRVICDTATFIVFFCFAFLLSWKALDMAWASISINERTWGAVRVPIYPKKIILAVGCVLLLLQGMAQFVRNVLLLTGHLPREGA